MPIARILIFLLFFSFPAFAQEYTGKVIGITDGDTLTVLVAGNKQLKVRLAEIDTPEKGQPYGQKSKDMLSRLVFGKQVTVKQVDIDRYGRTVATIYLQDMNVNKTMVANGAAWVYRDYSDDPKMLELEAKAKEDELGIWSLPEAQITPPWEWRKQQKSKAGSVRAISSSVHTKNVTSETSGFTCGGKKYCKQMSSCAEAKFYLSQCGLSRLDGDGDGVPCESVC